MEEKDSKLSIMIIPKTKKVRRITIPNWLPKSILICLVVVSILILFSFKRKSFFNSTLEKNCLNQVKQMADLEKEKMELQRENNKKDDTIAHLQLKNQSLNNKSREIEIKLIQIDKLKKHLEKMDNTN